NYKGENKISIYVSKDNTYLKEEFNGLSENYLIVKDKRLENLLKRFFEELWLEEDNTSKNDKEQVLKLLSDALNYIEILDNNINIKKT
ncbi:MAG: hypothetical protein ACRCXA_03550, partial [Peptostreptococcaceae bacterium]